VRGIGLCWLMMCAAVFPLASQNVKELEKKITEFTLPNGLKFLVLERHDAPAVSFHTYVRVGSADDTTGHTGLAYLFERVLFTGSEAIGSKNWAEERKALDTVETLYDQLEGERNLGPKASQSRVDTLRTQVRLAIDTAHRYALPGAYGTTLEENGSTRINVNTSPDATEVSYSLPSNRIELWFLMESQRLTRPVFRDFYAERDSVEEERQKHMEAPMQTQVYARMRLVQAFTAAAFQAHPYRNPLDGWPGDIANLRRNEARAFFEKYYVPGNLVMTLVGDVNPAEARKLAEKYFGQWPARPVPPLIHTMEPAQPGPRTVVVESPGVPTSMVGYRRPDQFHKDDAAFDVLQLALGQGRTGLLYKELITEKHVAQTVQAFATFPAGRYPNVFMFLLTPAQGHTSEETQKALEDYLNRLKMQKLEPTTLARAKAQGRALALNRLAGNAGVASMLGIYEGSYGNWRKLFESEDDLSKVTADDIQRLLMQYFNPKARIAAYTVLPGQSGAQPAPRPAQPSGDKQ